MKVVTLYILIAGVVAVGLYHYIKFPLLFASIITSLLLVHLMSSLYSAEADKQSTSDIINTIKGNRKNNE